MKNIFVTIALLIGAQVFAQNNQTDAQGRKQGHWQKLYEGTNQVRYRGDFVNDIPVGTFTYYHENGKKKSVIVYRGETNVGYATMYETTGKIMAEGLFVDSKRDSVWRYYGPDGDLVTTTTFKLGIKHGLERTLYSDGSIAERVEYREGLKEGLWVRKYPDGSVRSRGTYESGVLEGDVQYYDQEGKPIWIGSYLHGKKHGTWYIFENGEQKLREVYRHGYIVESECLVDDCADLDTEEIELEDE